MLLESEVVGIGEDLSWSVETHSTYKPERISSCFFSFSSSLAGEDKRNFCFRTRLLKAELQGLLGSFCHCAPGDDGKPPAGGDSCFFS